MQAHGAKENSRKQFLLLITTLITVEALLKVILLVNGSEYYIHSSRLMYLMEFAFRKLVAQQPVHVLN